ncbi:rab family GTPase [Pelomyxa schiedti]|nr:rab family GTPase [Pelomyxa schiedti]
MAKKGGYDFLFKILVAGDPKVGKTTLIQSFIGNTNPPNSEGCYVKTINLEGKVVKLMLYETTGMQSVDTVTTSSFRGVHAIVLVFDTTRAATFEGLSTWLAEADKYTKDDVKKLVVGNVRPATPREVDPAQVTAFANSTRVNVVDADPAQPASVTAAFESVVRSLWSKVSLGSSTTTTASASSGSTTTTTSSAAATTTSNTTSTSQSTKKRGLFSSFMGRH